MPEALRSEARASLLKTLRRQLEQAQPPLRTIAADILAEGSRVDLIARNPLGDLFVISLGESDQDLELLTRALAHRRWVEQRIPDWIQLAPELELSGTVRILLFCTEFRPETIAAGYSLEPLVSLCVYRNLEKAAGPLFLEPVSPPPASPHPSTHPDGTRAAAAPIPQGEPPPASPTPPWAEQAAAAGSTQPASEFRSGLSEADLQITGEERREFV